MRQRDDIVPAETWVISDTHFGHKNIIGYCHRPDDFEQILLNEINAVVRDGDTLLHLGDLCYKGNSFFKNIIAPKIAATADVRKLLIAGNHDKQRYSFYKQCGWKLAHPFFIRYARPGTAPGSLAPQIKVEFDHYPSRSYLDGLTWRLHGHIHNNGYYDGRFKSTLGEDGLLRMEDTLVPFLRNHINLSVEQTKYKPVRLDQLLNAAVYGLLPGDSIPGDGDSPSASDLGKSSHHA